MITQAHRLVDSDTGSTVLTALTQPRAVRCISISFAARQPQAKVRAAQARVRHVQRPCPARSGHCRRLGPSTVIDYGNRCRLAPFTF